MKVGILGGGQLAKMLAIAAKPLNIEVICVDPTPNCCAQQVADVLHVVYEDTDAIIQYFQGVDCITIETENLPFEAVEAIANHFPIYPSLESIRITQDRKLEKNLLKKLAIPTVVFQAIPDWDHLYDFVTRSTTAIILKTCQGGYDGKGQYVIQDMDDAKSAWDQLKNYPLIAEQYCQFDAEVSIIAVRSRSGKIAFYPLTENIHRGGILRQSTAPINNKHLTLQAQEYAESLMTHFDYVGVMAIEFFVKNNNLLVNEIAPRVHNSGHWTIEGAQTSQFKNHLCAILDLPLGSTEALGYSTMLNIISEQPDSLPSMPGVYPHIYGKEARPNRKLGHITIHAHDESKMNELVAQTQTYL
ncbi:5-(carboxyamino)imidazole ribonucleotide synthase [Legionella sp. W05-934-2]|jgi:5-(carboxyamino)imidazole ribonucleotide synthase|uniref:5-(carboxyamino)imidazole ribonucleotide synthase n=1 Tax=Legionella sp. W05-934-2 TaxID=1198649 RepID=UPI003462B897